MISMMALTDARGAALATGAYALPGFFTPPVRSAGDDRRSGAPLVHVVADDEELRRYLEPLFLSAGLETRTYSDCEAFLDAPRADVPSCLILEAEHRLIRRTGLGKRLTSLRTRLPIVVVAEHADVPTAVEAMKSGACDFLEKPLDEQQVLEAVGAALRADRERRAADGRLAELRVLFQTLTARERQVMALVSAGKLNKQVAGELGVSEVTVKVHRGAAMRKMRARSLADLVRMSDALSSSPDW